MGLIKLNENAGVLTHSHCLSCSETSCSTGVMHDNWCETNLNTIGSSTYSIIPRPKQLKGIQNQLERFIINLYYNLT